MSVEDYLAWERAEVEKHEYFDGEVFAMAGGSPRHNRLCTSVTAVLVNGVQATCNVFSSDQRLRTRENRYVYADIVVVCGALEIEHSDVITNPMIVVEVLSQSTEQYDRGLKWDGYQSLTSLTDYVLVSQDRAHIEHFGRSPTGGWTYTAVSAGQSLTLTNGVVLEVDKLFAGAFELKGDDAQTA
jgi:Uma2 family endonuclease